MNLKIYQPLYQRLLQKQCVPKLISTDTDVPIDTYVLPRSELTFGAFVLMIN